MVEKDKTHFEETTRACGALKTRGFTSHVLHLDCFELVSTTFTDSTYRLKVTVRVLVGRRLDLRGELVVCSRLILPLIRPKESQPNGAESNGMVPVTQQRQDFPWCNSTDQRHHWLCLNFLKVFHWFMSGYRSVSHQRQCSHSREELMEFVTTL